ncbi:MAG: hypothetical protein R3264_17625 [Anaerolineae bacterium]|nr:hypothetical protein [Anaerolineae bacterium]
MSGTQKRVVLSLVLFLIGLGLTQVIPGALGFGLGWVAIFLILVVWAIPSSDHRLDKPVRTAKDDRVMGKVYRVLIGVGAGLILAPLAVFLPTPLFWTLTGAAALGIFIWLLRAS